MNSHLAFIRANVILKIAVLKLVSATRPTTHNFCTYCLRSNFVRMNYELDCFIDLFPFSFIHVFAYLQGVLRRDATAGELDVSVMSVPWES
jgi:hypothetical protein